MHAFADLYDALDASTATSDKVTALVHYFQSVQPEDAAWALYFLAGGKPRQLVPTAVLRSTACQLSGVDDWLFDECYQAVGDLAETIALILPAAIAGEGADDEAAGLAVWVQDRLLPLRGLSPAEQSQRLARYWAGLDAASRFLLVKLIGGGLRVGVSKLLVQRALAQHAGLEPKLLAQRLVGWTDARATPSAARFAALLAPAGSDSGPAGQPYPFFLAHAFQATWTHWAMCSVPWPTGWWSGSTTASGRNWSSATARSGSGRVAKS